MRNPSGPKFPQPKNGGKLAVVEYTQSAMQSRLA